ncbi:hypothetical protein BMS3Abin11_00929 [bacterium BMS3Abin11]|nr:hypothetical protein BMS3Abin11_00929 [bacterium BMS3Abin11]
MPILDQEVEGNTTVGLVIPGAQSFTVGIDGYLSRLEVELSGHGSETRSYGIGLTRSSENGAPLDNFESNYLFYETGSLINQQPLTWIGFDLSDISVSFGEQLFIYL